MADKKISELDPTALLTGAEELAVVQPAEAPTGNVKITLDQIKEFVAAGDVFGPSESIDNEVAIFDGLTGKMVKKGGVTINRIINSIAMGLLEGGVLSINADPTKFDVSLGEGVIIDNYTDVNNPIVYPVRWSAFTAVVPTYLATNTSSHILIEVGASNGDGTYQGVIRQQTTFPTAQEHRDYIYLGQLGHTGLTTINAVVNKPEVATSPSDQLRDLQDFVGLINSGNLVSANGANLKINKSIGYLHGAGINFDGGINNKDPNVKTFVAQVTASLRRRTQTGNGTTSTDIDPANYDVGGTITAIVGTRYTNQRVFLTIAGNIVVQYGQTLYNNMSQAVAAINRESFVVFENVSSNAFPIAVISVRSTASDLSDTAQAQITFPTKFGELNAAAAGISVSTLQNAYNNSTEPEILTDSTRGAVTIKRGSAADTDNVLETKDGSDVTKFSVTGEGKVNLQNVIDEAQGTDIASAGTTDIGAATGNYVNVTGTTTITALGTVQAGTRRIVNFVGILILTHNPISLILPTAANITTAAGDVAVFISLGSGNWKCIAYTRADGTALVGSSGGHEIQDNGTPMATQPALNFKGLTVTDNPGNTSTDVEMTLANIESKVAGATAETTLLDTDKVLSFDSGLGTILLTTWANVRTYLNGYYQALITAATWGDFIVALTSKTTPVGADSIVISDSAAGDDAKKVSVTDFKAVILTDSALTGTPTAPTPAFSDDSTKVATTAFVKAQTLINVNLYASRNPMFDYQNYG